jgi:hypothetical protein
MATVLRNNVSCCLWVRACQFNLSLAILIASLLKVFQYVVGPVLPNGKLLIGGIMQPKGKLTPEGEVIAAYGAAMVAAFQVLINCLEENDALLPGQFPDALRVYMEMVKSKTGDVSDMTLAVLHDIRAATLD